jgi:hypothetical protein
MDRDIGEEGGRGKVQKLKDKEIRPPHPDPLPPGEREA